MTIIASSTLETGDAPVGPLVSALTTRIINLLGTDASLSATEVASLLQTRYEHLQETWSWSKRLRDFTLTLTAPIVSTSTTLATVSTDSPSVVFSGLPISLDWEGRQIRLAGEDQYFFILNAQPDALELADGDGNLVSWPHANNAATTWTIFQSVYRLPASVHAVVSLAGESIVEELDGGRARLDGLDPHRESTSTHPTCWTHNGVNANLFRMIEVWPVPTETRVLRGQHYRTAPTLATTDTLDMPAPILVYATAADACHLLHAKQGSTETMWENKALFFERKSDEVMRDYRPVDLELTSPPMTLGRSRYGVTSASDYWVSHPSEWP